MFRLRSLGGSQPFLAWDALELAGCFGSLEFVIDGVGGSFAFASAGLFNIRCSVLL